jgi:hypothetical protein
MGSKDARSRLPFGRVIRLTMVLCVAVVASGCGASHDAGKTPAPTTTRSVALRTCASYPSAKPKPQSCLSKAGYECSTYLELQKPPDCVTPAQRRSRAAAVKSRARREAVAAKASAARLAAANAWHKGYLEQDANVFWKWLAQRGCREFATNGCWHVEVITRDGCASYVAVNANEYVGGTIVNSLLDNQAYGIPAKTPRIFELDADQDKVTANNVTIDCT